MQIITMLTISTIVILSILVSYVLLNINANPDNQNIDVQKNSIIKKIAFYVEKKQKASTDFEYKECEKLIKYWQTKFKEL